MNRELLVTPLSTISPTRTRWAAKNQVPIGTITILAGMAGIAKSTILAWFIARWTHGTVEGDLHGSPALVALINGEDDTSSVLVPRLMAAGADLNMVVSMSSVSVTDRENDWISSPNLADDLRSIRAQIIETGARILIIDPIISLMAGDSDRKDDVRRNLDPLATMAAELGIAIICVAHFKKGSGRASDMLSGSHAFRDITRSLLLLAVDDETDERILTVEKSNYSAVKPSVAFNVDSVEIPTADGEHAVVGRAVMLGATTVTVEDLLRRESAVLGERSSELLEYVKTHPEGVRAEDVGQALDIPVNQARAYLSRLERTGRLQRISRGTYGSVSNTDATSGGGVASIAIVAKREKATLATHAQPSPGVANALRSGICPACGDESHAANAGVGYLHAGCEVA